MLAASLVLACCLQILSNFGVDVLEALSSTCTLVTRQSIGLKPLVSDLLVAFLLITAHGSVLMCQVSGPYSRACITAAQELQELHQSFWGFDDATHRAELVKACTSFSTPSMANTHCGLTVLT